MNSLPPQNGARREIALAIAPGHPAFAGHFPGRPIVPGVVLLDEALHEIGLAIGQDLSACHIANVKFLSPVAPGEMLRVAFDTGDGTGKGIRFDILGEARKVASGAIRLQESA
jgi:3-hydroxymyristoyl/3-hydroxydecanoyl-(acyl carrier protein) dehydratase